MVRFVELSINNFIREIIAVIREYIANYRE